MTTQELVNLVVTKKIQLESLKKEVDAYNAELLNDPAFNAMASESWTIVSRKSRKTARLKVWIDIRDVANKYPQAVEISVSKLKGIAPDLVEEKVSTYIQIG